MSDMASKYRALGDKAKAMMFDESFQQYFYDAAKEFERLQARVEALEADRDKRIDKWMQLIAAKDEHIERLQEHHCAWCDSAVDCGPATEQGENHYDATKE